ncbi:sulfatase [bacterium]|nr:sulfatase [bacterium]
MKRRDFLSVVGIGTGALLAGCGSQMYGRMSAAWNPGRKTNVLYILIDDLGWKDVSYNGHPLIETPNIDALSRQGVTFTDAYAAAPLCTPTRAAGLTSKAPARLWLTKALISRDYPLPAGPVDPRFLEGGPFVDKARVRWPQPKSGLDADEKTVAQFLKEKGYTTGIMGKWHLGRPDVLPEKFGFDVNVGGGHWPSPPLPGRYFAPYGGQPGLEEAPEGEYLTDRLTDEAIGFMETNQANPFFLYLSHYDVHGIWQAPPDLVEYYRGKAERLGVALSAHYAAKVHAVDRSVGRVLEALDRLGLAGNTLVIFHSDNGPVLEITESNAKGSGFAKDEPRQLTTADPLKGHKGDVYEGGIRVPTIIHWPGVTKPGSVSHEPVVTMDFMPTILEAVGCDPYPVENMDGVSLVSLLREGLPLKKRALYGHFPHLTPMAAVRDGQWKLVHTFFVGDELYDLENDIGETKNLSGEMPEKTEELRAKLEAWLKEVNAQMPTLNPRVLGKKEAKG